MAVNKRSRYWIIMLLVLGVLGGLMFFPVHLSDGYTCFYHRIFNHEHPAMMHTQQNQSHAMNTGDNELIDLYVNSYALFWWGSLVLVAFTVYRLKFQKRHTIIKNKNDRGGS